MRFVFVLFFFAPLAWSEISNCGTDCTGNGISGGNAGNGLCYTESIVFSSYDGLVSDCRLAGGDPDYCICRAVSYCPGNYMIRGSCRDSPFPPPPVSSSSSEAVVIVPPVISSSSAGGSTGNGNGFEFDFNEAKRGFTDFNDIFIQIFACFLVIRLLRMI